MKKLLSTLVYGVFASATTTALAAPACGDGINTLKTWDGGGANNSWNTAANWNPDGVPDCDDDVQFNGTSTKWCYVTSAIQVRDFSILSNWKGRIFIRGYASASMRNLVMNGGYIGSSDSNSLFQANNISMESNAFLSVKTALVKGTFTMAACQFSVRSKGYLDVQNLILNNFTTFYAPNGYGTRGMPTAGVVFVRGDLSRQALVSFFHGNGLLRLCGSGNGTITTNNILFTFWNVEIDKKRDGAGDTTAPGHLYSNPTTNDRIFALNRLSIIEATLTGWSVNDWVAGGDSVIVENSMANNDNTHNFSNTGHATLAFLGSGNGKFFHKTLLSGTYNVRVEKGNATDMVTILGLQDIGDATQTIHIAKGRLAFDGSGTARLRASVSSGLHVLADGQLVAPDNDTLYFAGCWDFANSNAFNPQNGILVLDGIGNRLTFTHHGDTAFFNELVITVSNGGSQGTLSWGSTFDVVYVRGDLKLTSPDAYFANVQLLLEGDFISAQTTPNSASKFTEMLAFKGSNNQTVTLSAASKDAYKQFVELDKTGGVVDLGYDLDARGMRFTGGVLNTNGYLLNITMPTMLYGGNSGSYINGPVTVAHGGLTWPASLKVPVGKSSTYNPIYINNGTTGNTYTIEYFDSGYSGTNTVNSPLDAVSTTEYWKVDRIAGASAYQVGLPTTNAPGGWANADIRVAGNDGTGWNNLGPGTGASGGLVTSTTGTTSSTRYFTLGVDNASPMVLTHDGISGKEVQTERFNIPGQQFDQENTPQMQVFPNPAQQRFAITLEHAGSGMVSVSDLNGRILFTGNVQGTQWIDCSSWSSGIYLVRFTDGINSITRRISVSY